MTRGARVSQYPCHVCTVYVGQSSVTDPEDRHGMLTDLPRDIEGLAALVRGLVVHRDRVGDAQIPNERLLAEPQMRRVVTMLERIRWLDDRPLSAPRVPAHRLIGHCRSSSVLLCALLRKQGVAARARCGFSVYYAEGRSFYGDHWVVEYWNETNSRWQLADAELDAETRAQHGVTFDPLDVPRTQLILAATAWLECRAQPRWGWYGQDPTTTGRAYVGNQLLRDAACLGKQEVGAFDNWLPPLVGQTELATLDRLALATQSLQPDVQISRLWAEDLRLRPPTWSLADS